MKDAQITPEDHKVIFIEQDESSELDTIMLKATLKDESEINPEEFEIIHKEDEEIIIPAKKPTESSKEAKIIIDVSSTYMWEKLFIQTIMSKT